jgi:hypothetical protein
MTPERREFETNGILALLRASDDESSFKDDKTTITVGFDGTVESSSNDRPHERSFFSKIDGDKPVVSPSWASKLGSKISASSSGFFVTGSDVREKLLSLEGQIGSLDRDMAAEPRRDLIRNAWMGFKSQWYAKAAAIRSKNSVSLNLVAGKIMDELDADQVLLSRWRETLLAEGGTLTSPEPAREKKRGDVSLGTMLKWTAYAAALFGVGYALKGFSDAAKSGTGILQWIKPRAPALLPATSSAIAPAASFAGAAPAGDLPISVRLPSGDILHASSLREAASAIEGINRPLLGRSLTTTGLLHARELPHDVRGAYSGLQEE